VDWLAILGSSHEGIHTVFELVGCLYLLFSCNDPPPTEIYTLSLHDALPISCATDRASQHGPYYQLSWKEKGKTVSRRLPAEHGLDRKSTRLNSSHLVISYAVFCLKKKKQSRKLPLKLTQNSQR